MFEAEGETKVYEGKFAEDLHGSTASSYRAASSHWRVCNSSDRGEEQRLVEEELQEADTGTFSGAVSVGVVLGEEPATLLLLHDPILHQEEAVLFCDSLYGFLNPARAVARTIDHSIDVCDGIPDRLWLTFSARPWVDQVAMRGSQPAAARHPRGMPDAPASAGAEGSEWG
jgi:hypothetical protein